MKTHTLILPLIVLAGCSRDADPLKTVGNAVGIIIILTFAFLIFKAIQSLVLYVKTADKQIKRIERLKVFSGIFLALGILSSLVVLFTAGIVEEYKGLFMGTEWKFYPGGIMSAIMTLFMSFFIYYGCRVVIYIAEQVTPKAEDKAQE